MYKVIKIVLLSLLGAGILAGGVAALVTGDLLWMKVSLLLVGAINLANGYFCMHDGMKMGGIILLIGGAVLTLFMAGVLVFG